MLVYGFLGYWCTEVFDGVRVFNLRMYRCLFAFVFHYVFICGCKNRKLNRLLSFSGDLCFSITRRNCTTAFVSLHLELVTT